MAAAFLALSALLAQHLGHYRARAQANERALLAEIMAQPICTGAPPAASPAGEPAQTRLVRHTEQGS